MKFSKRKLPGKRWAYDLVLSEYDSVPPTNQLVVDELPLTIEPNREAVALYLIFGRWCGGEFSLPSAISPNTADVISAEGVPVRINVTPIEYYPKRLAIGTRRIECTDDEQSIGIDNSFVALPSHRWAGSLRSYDALAVSSNAFAFQEDEKDLDPILGLAVLFSETLSADEIVVAESRLKEHQRQRFSRLLNSVRLGLKTN